MTKNLKDVFPNLLDLLVNMTILHETARNLSSKMATFVDCYEKEMEDQNHELNLQYLDFMFDLASEMSTKVTEIRDQFPDLNIVQWEKLENEFRVFLEKTDTDEFKSLI